MSSLTEPRRIPARELRRRRKEIDRLYPYEPKRLPEDVSAADYFVHEKQLVRIVEQHVLPQMPAALFFTGTYRAEPFGPDAAEKALRDLDAVLKKAGHSGRCFAVAGSDGRDGRTHVHAIIDYGPGLDTIGRLWADAHGVYKAGGADPGAYYYVVKRARVADSVIHDRTGVSSAHAA